MVGKMYGLTAAAKKTIQNNRLAGEKGYLVHYISFDRYDRYYKIDVVDYKYFPLDSRIVVLEVHNTHHNGSLLSGKNSCRVIALLEDSSIGTIYLSTQEWEQVESIQV